MRYEIKILNGTFYVWDNEIGIWQTSSKTRETAEAWIAWKILVDAEPRNEKRRIKITMPLRD